MKEVALESMTQIPGDFSVAIRNYGFVLTTDNTSGYPQIVMIFFTGPALSINVLKF